MSLARILIHEIDESMKIPTFDTKILLTIAFSCMGMLVLLGIFYLLGSNDTPLKVTEIGGIQNQYTDVTDGEHQEVDAEKIDAYQKSGKRQPYELAWDDAELSENMDLGMPTTDQASSEVTRRNVVTADEPTSSVAKNAQGYYADLTAASEPAKAAAPAAPRRSGGGPSSSRPMTQKERDDKVRHDYELASEIAQKMYGIDTQGNPVSSVQENNTQQEQRITVPAGHSQRSSSSSISRSIVGFSLSTK